MAARRDPRAPVLTASRGPLGPEGLTRQERWGVASDLKARHTAQAAGTSPSSREGAELHFPGHSAPHSPCCRITVP